MSTTALPNRTHTGGAVARQSRKKSRKTKIPWDADENGITEWRDAIEMEVLPYVDSSRLPVLMSDKTNVNMRKAQTYIGILDVKKAPNKDKAKAEMQKPYLTESIDHLAAYDNNQNLVEIGGVTFDANGPLPNLYEEIVGPSRASRRASSPTSEDKDRDETGASTPAAPSPKPQPPPEATTAEQVKYFKPSIQAFSTDELWHGLVASVNAGSLPDEVLLGEHPHSALDENDDPMERELECPYLEALENLDFVDPENDTPIDRPSVFEVHITFDEDSIAIIRPSELMASEIVVEMEGVRTVWPFDGTHLNKLCYEIVREHRVTGVTAFNQPPDQKPINTKWLRCVALKTFLTAQGRPELAVYTAIQQRSSLNEGLCPSQECVDFVYSAPDKGLCSLLAAHYVLRFPIAPVLSPMPPLSEEEYDSQYLSPHLANLTLLGPPTEERNLSVSALIKRIFVDSLRQKARRRTYWQSIYPDRPFEDAQAWSAVPEDCAFVDEWQRPEVIECPLTWDHYGTNANRPYSHEFDLQAINWEDRVRQRRQDMRSLRWISYKNHRNLEDNEMPTCFVPLDETLNAVNVVPKSMTTKHKPYAPHFQLRNMLATRDALSVVYANTHKVYSEYLYNSQRETVIDLSKPNNTTCYIEPVRICSLGLSTEPGRDIVMVGGMDGTFAYKNLNLENGVTEVGTTYSRSTDAIVNHIDIDVWANRGKMRATVCCNDRRVRTLDLETGQWLYQSAQMTGGKKATGAWGSSGSDGTRSGWEYPWCVNASAASPEGKLRVFVADTPDVAIVNTETGRLERMLKGHYDYGFACAWSPDGLHVATANQDRLVKVYDARTWKCLSTWQTQNSVRNLKFSPVGGGTRALLCAESADRITVVNAHHFNEGNTQEFFGEVAGVDWWGDGHGLVVGNMDQTFGGFMEYERRGYGARSGLAFQQKRQTEEAGEEYREEGPDEWVSEERRWRDWRCIDPGRVGQAGNWWRSRQWGDDSPWS